LPVSFRLGGDALWSIRESLRQSFLKVQNFIRYRRLSRRDGSQAVDVGKRSGPRRLLRSGGKPAREAR